jgi:hypothetical protein
MVVGLSRKCSLRRTDDAYVTSNSSNPLVIMLLIYTMHNISSDIRFRMHWCMVPTVTHATHNCHITVVHYELCCLELRGRFLFLSLNNPTTNITASVVQWLAYWPLEPVFAGSNPAIGFSGIRKILSMPSFGEEVK